MSLIERYILKALASSFFASLLVLTGIIWVTQILRDFDLVTAQGQTVLVLFRITMLSLPALVVVIAPIALFIAIAFVFMRLNSDSELITMHAAGLSPLRLLRAPLILTLMVSALVGWMTLDLVPQSFRGLRDLITVVRADVVSNIIREGRFNTIEQGLTFHVRERGTRGVLKGIFVQDRRDPQQILTYMSELGRVIEEGDTTYLLLENGTLQRQNGPRADAAVVAFERYAIDLSQFLAIAAPTTYKPRERTTAELLFPVETEEYYQWQKGRFRAELHDRFAAPLFTLVFGLLAYFFLGLPKTTRQGRLAAVAAAIGAAALFRTLGFSASSLAAREEWGVALVYLVPTLGLIACAAALIAFQTKLLKVRL